MSTSGSQFDTQDGARAGGKSVTRYLYIIVFLIFVLSAKGYLQVSDTFASVETAESVVQRGRLDIPQNEWSTYTRPDGQSYSKYGIWLPLYYVPLVALSECAHRATGFPRREMTGFLISFANIPFAILLLYLFARLLRSLKIGEFATGLLVAALGLGTLCWYYALSDFSEVTQTALLLASIVGVVERTRRGEWFGGMAFGWLVLVKLVHVALLPAFLIYLVARSGRSLRERVGAASRFLVPVALALGFVAGLNYWRFGNPLESGYGREATQFFPSQIWWTIPRLLFSMDKGLFVFSPILLFGLLGWGRFAHRHLAEALLCGALILCTLVLSGAWHSWIGGWSWGPRLLVPTIPLWLLPAAYWLEGGRSTIRSSLFILATCVSAISQIPGILVKDQEIHHIKQVLLTPEERASSPSDYTSAWRLLRFKVTRADSPEIYRATDFGAHEDRELDLTPYQTFRGINVWTEHMSRRLKLNGIRWLPLVLIVLGGFCAVRAQRVWVRGNRQVATECNRRGPGDG